MILDSGFPYTLVSTDRLDTACFRIGPVWQEAMPGGDVEINRVYDITIHVGGISITADSLRGFRLAGLEPMIGNRMDGIVGHDFFETYVVTVDYENEVITLRDPDGFAYTGNGEIVDVTIESGEVFIVGEVQHPDGTWRKAKLKLDTGSADIIGFNGSFIQSESLLHESQPRLAQLGFAVGGETQNWVTRLSRFRVGGVIFERPVVGYSVDTRRGGDAGTIGAGFLSRFTAIFDYARKRIILEPNSRIQESFDYDMSGCFVSCVPPDFGGKQVIAVTPGTPAHTAGIQPGDLILEVDDQEASAYSITELRALLSRAGPVKLRIEHDGKTSDVVLELRPLI